MKTTNEKCPFCEELRNLKETDAFHRTRRGDTTTQVKYKVCIAKETYSYPDDPECCTGLLTGTHHELKFCPLCGKDLSFSEQNDVFEVVCTQKLLDVGLAVEVDGNDNPTKVMARHEQFSATEYYGGVNYVQWRHTGKFLSKEEWKKVSANKSTDEVLSALGINKALW